MPNQRPILITGAHRSGTTWVGKMLAASSEVGYIQEPFNLEHRPGICRTDFKHWFTYITGENQSDYYKDIKGTLDFSYNLVGEIRSIQSTRDALRLVRDCLHFQKYRMTKARPLIKDPLAFFSTEWLVDEFDVDVVMTIRHPAAFVSGLKVKNWAFEFFNFLEQPLLMRDYLSPFEDEIREYAREPKPILDQGILLWKIFYSIIDSFKQKHPNWIFVRHEDLARDPLVGFQALYQQLGVTFSSKERTLIESYTCLDNPSQAPGRKKIFGSNVDLSVKRSSQSSIKNWKSRLAPAEINTIRDRLQGISDKFYTEADWS